MEGVEEDIFEIENIARTALVITKTLQGLDVPYIKDDMAESGADKDDLCRTLVSILLQGLRKRI